MKPETGDKEANFPYPFTQNLLPRTSAAEVRGAAAVNAPSTDASMKSRSGADDPPPPREINQWGTTICPELLEVSSLLVCRLTRTDLASEVEVLVKCSPKEDASDQWHLFILAAPKKLLMLRGEKLLASAKDMVQTWRQHRRMLRLKCLRLQAVCIQVDTLPQFFGTELPKTPGVKCVVKL